MASIIPNNNKKSHLETVLEEVEAGQVVGPFNSVKDLMKDLLE